MNRASNTWVALRDGLPRLGKLMVLICLISACTSPEIYKNPDFNPPVRWGSHTVDPGDSLYAIAWRYSRDPMEIARANRLAAPYRLYPGQRLSLVPPDHEDVESRNAEAARGGAHSASSSGGAPTGSANDSNYKKKHKAEQSVTGQSPGGALRWQWPHSGPIIDRFSVAGSVNKGIDIAGKTGDAVRAAGDGEVVYAGEGLIGYGPLVIINHNDDYLSAYAHNRKLLVSEGQRVKAGHIIAELGKEGASRPKVHFEIRKNGQPVDPLRYLPKRQL